MRRHIITDTLLVLYLLSWAADAGAAPGQLATSFEANRGQAADDVRFTHRSRDFELSVLSSGALRVAALGWKGTIAFGPSEVERTERVAGTEERAGTANVFVGADPAEWVTGIPLFGGVLVRGVGPGVDLALSADGRRVLLEFRAAPDANASLLRFTIEGAEHRLVDSDLVVPIDGGALRLSKPTERSDAARPGWTMSTTIEVVPSAGKGIDSESTDVRLALASDGGAYIAGSVDRGRGFDDAFVARIQPDRSTLAWVAYLGGAGASRVSGIVVDASGQPVFAGDTHALNFPLVRPVQATPGGGSDAFVTRLADDGSSLAFSTLLGGQGADAAEGIALAPDGTIVVAGSTSSRDLPFKAADDGDAFVATIDADGARVVSTAMIDLGGIESADAIAIDRQGISHIAGESRHLHRSQPFVAKLGGASGDEPRFSAIGEDYDGAVSALALDGRGRVWIAGWLTAPDLGPGHNRRPLLAECAPDGSTRVVPSASEADSASTAVALAFDSAGKAWLAEETRDGVRLSRWAPEDATSREVVSQLAGVDRAGGIAVARDGSVIVSGSTRDARIESIVGPIATNAGAVLMAVGGGGSAPAAAGCPGTISFDNSAGTGLWQTPTNWDLDRLPNSTDDVCIGPGFAVTLSSGTQSIGTLFTDPNSSLAVTAGTLSIAAVSEVNGPLTLQGGTISGTGNITVSGLTTWTGGSMTGAATTNTNGGLSMSGAAVKDVTGSRVLNATGNTTLTGTGGMRVGSGGVINNTGIWDCQSDAPIAALGGAAGFNNNASGTFRKSAGSGTTAIGIVFNNASTVEILTGILSLNSGGTHGGSFTGSPGATLRFSGGTSTLGATSSINAATVDFAVGTVNIDGTYVATSSTTASGATVNFNAASTITGVGSALTITGGTVNFNSGDPVDPLTLAFSAGSLGGTDTITVSGLTTWTGGSMTGAATTNTNGGLSMSGAAVKDVTGSRVLNATGNTTLTGTGGMRVGSGGVINNTGIWDCQSDAPIAALGGAAGFNNNASGTFRKSAGSGTTAIGIVFNNASTVEILTGILSLNSGGTHGGSFTGSPGATLRFSGGTSTLGATSSINAATVDFAVGTVNIDGTYVATSSTTASGATVNFNAASTITGVGSALTITGGTVNFNSGDPVDPLTLAFSAGSLGGTDTITVSGLTTWTGGSMTGAATTNTNGGLSMSGAAVKDVTGSRVLNATGNTTLTGTGGMRVGSGGVINNTGIWDCQSDAPIAALGGAAGFNNNASGTFRKSAGSGTTAIGIVFNNASTVEILTGILSLNSGGTHGGSFTGSPGATLRFSGGTSTLGATSSINAATVDFAVGTVNIDGTYVATSSTTASGATVNFNAASTITGVGSALTITGGTVNFNSGDPVDPLTLAFSAGSLGGTDTITVSGLTTWTGGSMTGAATTNTNGGLSMSGAAVKDVTGSRVLNATGNTTLTGTGGMRVGSGGVINNTGIWDCQSDAPIAALGGAAGFNNNASGTFRKSAGSGTTAIGIVFNNASTVEILTGILSLNSGGTHGGSFTGSPGATLRFSGGTSTLGATSSINAATVDFAVGTVNIDGTYVATSSTTASGATVNFNAASTITGVGSALTITGGTVNFNSGDPVDPLTLAFSAGSLGGTDTITVSGLTTWTGGSMTGAATTNTNGGLSMSGAAVKDVTGSRVLNATGNTTLTGTGGMRVGSGGVINNTGIWDCQSDAPIAALGGAAGFNNNASGTFRKSAGAGTTTVNVPFTTSGFVDALSGTLSFPGGYPQAAGTTTQNGGVITSPTPLDIQGGLLRGIGTVAASVTNAGQTAPGLSPGILATSANYTQTAAGSFAVEIGGLAAGAEHDRLEVAGVATLAGALQVTLVNGFIPSPGDEFTILTCGSRNGTFTSSALPPLPPGRQWRIDYFATTVKLVVLSNAAGRVPGDLVAETTLTASKTGSNLTLTWGVTCVPTDTDFAVYEGALGNFTSHIPVQCSTGGATTATILPAAGARYYLVTAHNGGEEGSYGYTGSGAERTMSGSACHPQNIASCP